MIKTCQHCGVQFDKHSKYAGHITWCEKNPNSLKYRKNECQFCKELICVSSYGKHEAACSHNPNNIKYCQNCNTQIFNLVNIFCNQSCAAEFNNKDRKIDKYCIHCGAIRSNDNDKYCSKKCEEDFKYNKNINRWKSGFYNSIIAPLQIRGFIRKYLFIKYDNKCSRCGWNKINPVTGKSPLEVEHIDGNYQNNNEDNLTLLCPNCHSLTPTYKNLNKGRGRKNRK